MLKIPSNLYVSFLFIFQVDGYDSSLGPVASSSESREHYYYRTYSR